MTVGCSLAVLVGLCAATPASIEPMDGEGLVLVMLRAEASGSEFSAEDIQYLSEGHMANIDRLAEEEILVSAGPLAPTTDARGVFVLRAGTLEEAREIVAGDPAVSAGLLRADLSSFVSPDPLLRLPELERAARQAREAREPGTADAFEMAAYTLATTAATQAAEQAVVRLREEGHVVFSGTAADGPDAGVWVVLNSANPGRVKALLGEAGETVQWSELTWYASAQLAHLPRLGLRSDAPSFEILDLQESFAPFKESFVKRVEVFSVHVFATEGVRDAKLLHAAHVLAQYLDNDEDGSPDDGPSHEALIDGGAYLVMAATEREARTLEADWEALEEAGFHIGQDLYDEETLPQGPPHVRIEGRFDAALEEVWHLVSNGWAAAYPEAFAYERGSSLCDAMDVARGGRFDGPPRRYPDQAWYHYDDRTCDYECMAAEYFYWTLTSLLGGQDYPGRAEEIADEWECPTAETLERADRRAFTLLTDPRFDLPRILPDGDYGP